MHLAVIWSSFATASDELTAPTKVLLRMTIVRENVTYYSSAIPATLLSIKLAREDESARESLAMSWILCSYANLASARILAFSSRFLQRNFSSSTWTLFRRGKRDMAYTQNKTASLHKWSHTWTSLSWSAESAFEACCKMSTRTSITTHSYRKNIYWPVIHELQELARWFAFEEERQPRTVEFMSS